MNRTNRWDALFVYIGVIVVWLLKRCNYSLSRELGNVPRTDYSCRPEGVIGLVIVIAVLGLMAAWRLHVFSD
jgi:hypothetical protein